MTTELATSTSSWMTSTRGTIDGFARGPAKTSRRRRMYSKVLLSGVCLSATIGCERRDTAAEPAPNIIFVLVDTLRADRVGAYGGSGGHTPTLNAIAREGVVFDEVIAQSPWTQPSMASLFCSRYPTAHKVLRYEPIQPDGARDASRIAVLSPGFQTLPELLQEKGYETAGFVANPLMLADYGFAQGFDTYDTSFADNRTPGNIVNEAALAWLEKRASGKPFFLYLHYMDVHGPYNAGPEFLDGLLDAVDRRPNKTQLSPVELDRLGYLRQLPKVRTDEARHTRLAQYREYWEARYESGVREFDHHLARLKAGLQESKLWDDAYVIITSDHGESLCEHGFWKHGWTMYHAELHVPLVLRWPGVLTRGQHIAQRVRLIDILPTLVDQLRLPAVEDAQGVSLRGLLTGTSALRSPPALAEAIKIGPERKALYLDEWKLIVNSETDERRLYRIGEDLLEQTEISARFPEVVDRLHGILREQMGTSQQLAKSIEEASRAVTPEQIERLKALGYIGDD